MGPWPELPWLGAKSGERARQRWGRGEEHQGDESSRFVGSTRADRGRGGGSAWSSWRRRAWQVSELVPAEMGDLDTASRRRIWPSPRCWPPLAGGHGRAAPSGSRQPCYRHEWPRRQPPAMLQTRAGHASRGAPGGPGGWKAELPRFVSLATARGGNPNAESC